MLSIQPLGFHHFNCQRLYTSIFHQLNEHKDGIQSFVTKRDESLLKADFEKYNAELSKRINGKKVLVIGGAGPDSHDWPRTRYLQIGR